MNQDPEMPPVTPQVEGTDFDETLRLAQEEKKKADDAIRMNDAFGVVPGRLPSDEQFTAMQDFQGAVDGHEARVAEINTFNEANMGENGVPKEEYFFDSDKPLDAVQQEQVKEDNDLDYLTSLFGESTDKDHLDSAWKLFDEFVDKKDLSRDAERQLRDHFMNINHGVAVTAETPSQPTPETPAPGDEPSPEGAEAKPTGEPKPEASPDATPDDTSSETTEGPKLFDYDAEGVFDDSKVTEGEAASAEGADAEKSDDTQDSGEGGEAGGEKPEEGEPKPEGEGEEEKPTEEAKPEGGPVLYNWEDEATFEDEPLDEEKERISIWTRMKAGGEKVRERIDHYFNGGTEEQNSRRKMVAVGIGVGAVGILLAVGVGVGVHNADMANLAPQVTTAFHGAEAALPGPGFGVHEIVSGASAHINTAGETLKAVSQNISGSGDTIWAHAHTLLEQWGVKPSNGNILRLTRGILTDNGLGWDSARHLANGAKFVVNIPSWIK